MTSYFVESRLLPAYNDPVDPSSTRVDKFRRFVNRTHGLDLGGYHDLHAYSVSDWNFWLDLWKFLNIKSTAPPSVVIAPGPTPETPIFFPDVPFNYAENILHPWMNSDTTAITALDETLVASHYAGRTLVELVREMSRAMRSFGVKKGDRVAAVIRNSMTSVVVALATASIGAIFSSTATDMGTQGILDRYTQIDPILVFAESRIFWAGKAIDVTEKIIQVSTALRNKTGASLKGVVMLAPALVAGTPQRAVPNSIPLETFLAKGDDGKKLEFEQVAFSHPAYILYSSGTSGPPKCIVHSGGGVLLQGSKDLVMGFNLSSDDTYFHYTTTGWMMWPFMINSLAVGARIVLYDGSPFHPTVEQFLRFVSDQGITLLGTSPRFLGELQGRAIDPLSIAPFPSLRRMLITGAVLTAPLCEWTHCAFGSKVRIISGTGGTDICGIFLGGVPTLPVYAGEIQGKSLGMKVEIFSPTGQNIEHTGEAGELVCTRPHPSIPVCFWGDNDGCKFRNAYYDMFPGVWRHGDFMVMSPKTKGFMILGRSDGVLNPSGVRFGSAEIYAALEQFSSLIDDAICVGQRRPQDTDERVLLFVKMRAGMEGRFDEAFEGRIKAAIRKAFSARHVPAYVFRVDDIPYTVNGKKIEIAVKQIVSGTDVKPSDAVANPASLLLYYKYRDLESLVRREDKGKVKAGL